jgi:hypothetical protein
MLPPFAVLTGNGDTHRPYVLVCYIFHSNFMTFSSNACTFIKLEILTNVVSFSQIAPCKVIGIAFGNITIKDENATPSPDTNSTVVIYDIVLSPGTTVAHGKSIGVKCETHYEASHLLTVFPPTCDNGTWSHEPKCQPGKDSFKIVLLLIKNAFKVQHYYYYC